MARTIDTGTEHLLARVEDRVGVITINRPERRNALSQAMYGGIDTALTEMRDDDEVRCVMVTGAAGAFCAGGDVKAMNESHNTGTGFRAEMTAEERLADLQLRQRQVSLAMHETPSPSSPPSPARQRALGFRSRWLRTFASRRLMPCWSRRLPTSERRATSAALGS